MHHGSCGVSASSATATVFTVAVTTISGGSGTIPLVPWWHSAAVVVGAVVSFSVVD